MTERHTPYCPMSAPVFERGMPADYDPEEFPYQCTCDAEGRDFDFREVVSVPPQVVTGPDGSLQLEWHRSGVDVEIVLHRNREIEGWWDFSG